MSNIDQAQNEYLEKIKNTGKKDYTVPKSTTKETTTVKSKPTSKIDNTRNKNLSDAQKDYAQSLKPNGIDASVSGSMRYPGASNQRTGVTNSTIDNYLSNGSLKEVTNRGAKISDLGRTGTRMMGMFAYSTIENGSDAGQGMRLARDTIGTAALIAAERAGESLAKSLKYGYFENNILEGQTEKFAGNLAQEKQRVIAEIRKRGLGDLSGANGQRMVASVLRIRMKNKENLTAKDLALLNKAMKLGQQEGLSAPNNHRLLRRMQMQAERYLKQCEAGQGLALIIMIKRRGSMAIRAAQKSIRSASRAAAMVAKKAQAIALKASIAKLRRQMKYAKSPQAAKAMQQNFMKKRGKKLAKKNARHLKRRNSLLGRTRDRLNRLQQWRKDPFKLKAKGRALAHKLLNKIPGFNKLNVVKRLVAKIVQAIMTVISTIISALMFVFVILLLVVIIAMLISVIISAVTASYDYDTTDEETKSAIFNEIKTSYESQAKNIQSLYSSYNKVTLKTEDLKDAEAYEDKNHKTDDEFTETTNSVEIMCMATIYFDFDLDGTDIREVRNYVKKLYNGSHKTIIDTSYYEVSDENGKVTKYTNADITLQTYYFNGIFDCSLRDSVGLIQSGTEIMIPQEYEQCWTVTTYERKVDDYRNDAGPRVWTSGTVQRQLYDEWVAAGRTYENGLATLNGRYLVAVVDTLGVPGQYIDVYLDDGTVWPCRIADQKSRGDSTICDYGHMADGALNVVEWEVQYDYYHMYGNPGSDKWRPDLKGKKVLKVINGGFNEPESTDAIGQKIVDAARSQLGVPYVWGGTTPGQGLDCSGLCQYAYSEAGISIPRTSEAIARMGTRVDNPMPGDICWTTGHVAIYIGNGQMIEAQQSGTNIMISNVRATYYIRYR